MANRAKRLEKESKLVKDRQALQSLFKKNKKQRQFGLRPTLTVLVNANSFSDFRAGPNSKIIKRIFRQIQSMRNNSPSGYKAFLKILNHPKLLFTHLTYYEKLGQAFFELEPCRDLNTWKLPKSKNDDVIFKNLFCFLFSKYRIPKFIEREIFEYACMYSNVAHLRLQIIYQVVKGLGIHKVPSLSIEMNSKMNFFFMNAPSHYNIEKAMWWAKMRSMKVPMSIASQMIDNLPIDINQNWNDWHNEFVFFVNRFPSITPKNLKKIAEFMIRQELGGVNVSVSGFNESIWIPALYPDFSLKGRTVASVLRFVEKWNAYIQLVKEKGSCGNFVISSVKSFRKIHNKSIIGIRQIITLKALYKEGHHMSHCVATYAEDCIKGHSSIWSMRQFLSNGKSKRMVTIEVQESDKKIVQVSGKSNRGEKMHEIALIKSWAKQEGLEYTPPS